jgi:hypothetical protein
VRSSSQQQPAATTSQRCCHITQHKAPRSATASRQRRCSVEVDARISGSRLRFRTKRKRSISPCLLWGLVSQYGKSIPLVPISQEISWPGYQGA